MELNEMTVEQLEERRTAILAELDQPEADLDALEAEGRSIKAELESRAAEEAKKNEIREAVAKGAGELIEKPVEVEERKIMTNDEIRNSEAYINAFAEYVKSGDDSECRSLLTINGGGSVPVPQIVDDYVRTAWENEKILAGVDKTFVRGVYNVPFELSATGAALHEEGADAPTEEELVLGVVQLVPGNWKKWITISDEVMAMTGERFLAYIYDEITHRILKSIADGIVTIIESAPTTADQDNASITTIEEAPTVTTVGNAFSTLSDEADNLVIIMNKLTYATFLAAQAAGNFSFDPFMGLPVIFNNSVKAYSAAGSHEAYMIVGDLKGITVNYPEGEGIVLKFDDLSLAEQDLVKIVGRQYVAVGLTACGRFCVVTKPEGGGQ